MPSVLGVRESRCVECGNGVADCCSDTLTATLDRSLMRNEERREDIIDMHPFRGLGIPDDIARATLFLSSEESGWITGVRSHLSLSIDIKTNTCVDQSARRWRILEPMNHSPGLNDKPGFQRWQKHVRWNQFVTPPFLAIRSKIIPEHVRITTSRIEKRRTSNE